MYEENRIMDLQSVIFRTLLTSPLPDPPQPSSSSQSPLICSSTPPPLPVCWRSHLWYLGNDLPCNSWRQDRVCKLAVQVENFSEYPKFHICVSSNDLILKENSRIHRMIINNDNHYYKDITQTNFSSLIKATCNKRCIKTGECHSPLNQQNLFMQDFWFKIFIRLWYATQKTKRKKKFLCIAALLRAHCVIHDILLPA